jgi:hypothetical protein
MNKIISISESPKKTKRFRVYLESGKSYDFGLKNPKYGTYIDHGDKKKRMAYINRHLANYNEKKLIDNLIPSPALFSMALLWGESTNLYDNINILNEFL